MWSIRWQVLRTRDGLCRWREDSSTLCDVALDYEALLPT